MAGKGSKPRPLSVDYNTYADNYDRIFGNRNSQRNKKRIDALDELTRLGQEMEEYDNKDVNNPLRKYDD